MPKSNDPLGLAGLEDVLGFGGLSFMGVCAEKDLPAYASLGEIYMTSDGSKLLCFTGSSWDLIGGTDYEVEPYPAVQVARKYANCPCCGAPVNRGDTCNYCGCLYPII